MATVKELTAQVEELTAQIEALTAENEQLKTPLHGASDGVSGLRLDLFKAMAHNINPTYAKTTSETLLKAVDEVIKVLERN